MPKQERVFTVPICFGIDTFGVGIDTGAPASNTYKPPFAFNGQIEKIEIELRWDRRRPWAARPAAGDRPVSGGSASRGPDRVARARDHPKLARKARWPTCPENTLR